MSLVLKDSTGKPSISYTMLVVTFVCCIAWFILSIVETIGPIKIRAFSGGDAMAMLSPMALLYFGRKWQLGQGMTAVSVDTNTTTNNNSTTITTT